MGKKAFGLLGLLVALAVIAGMDFATGTAKPISQIPITQAFHYDLGTIGSFNYPGQHGPFAFKLPLTAGLAITQVSSPDGINSYYTKIRVNGVDVFRARVGTDYQDPGTQNVTAINPPILVPPGAFLEIGLFQWTTPTPFSAKMIVSGYYLTRADMGLE